MTPPAHTVELCRVFDAPADLVFEAWSRPDYWSRWFPPRGFTMTVRHMEFREGGTFDASFHGFGMEHAFSGVYVEVVPGERLVWTSGFPNSPRPDQMRTTVTFTAREGKTEVNVTHVFLELTPETEPAAQGAQEGWTQTLEKLGEFIAERTELPA